MGKAIDSIKRDGLRSGTKKIMDAFRMLKKPVEPGDVLFVTGGVGRSAIYRCHNQAEELNLHDIKASVVVQDNKELLSFAKTFKVFIFHRTIFDNRIERFIESIKKQNKTILFETDDLNYEPRHLHKTDYYKNINELERRQIKNGIGSEIINDEYVTHCVASTAFLAQKLREKGKQVFVSKNKLSQPEVEDAQKALRLADKSNRNIIKLGYFSGTPGHDRDFATIENVLIELLQEYSNMRLFIAGPLGISEKFDQVRDKIEQVSFVPMDRHFTNIANIDINLIPLEDDDFCRAKSEIKFIEAGIVSVPTIAFDNQTFKEAIENGVSGFLAMNNEEWKEKIVNLIENEELRKTIGKKAKEAVIEKYTTESEGNGEYYEFLKLQIDVEKNDGC